MVGSWASQRLSAQAMPKRRLKRLLLQKHSRRVVVGTLSEKYWNIFSYGCVVVVVGIVLFLVGATLCSHHISIDALAVWIRQRLDRFRNKCTTVHSRFAENSSRSITFTGISRLRLSSNRTLLAELSFSKVGTITCGC